MPRARIEFSAHELLVIREAVVLADAQYPGSADNRAFLRAVLAAVLSTTGKIFGAGVYLRLIKSGGVTRQPSAGTVQATLDAFRAELDGDASAPRVEGADRPATVLTGPATAFMVTAALGALRDDSHVTRERLDEIEATLKSLSGQLQGLRTHAQAPAAPQLDLAEVTRRVGEVVAPLLDGVAQAAGRFAAERANELVASSVQQLEATRKHVLAQVDESRQEARYWRALAEDRDKQIRALAEDGLRRQREELDRLMRASREAAVGRR